MQGTREHWATQTCMMTHCCVPLVADRRRGNGKAALDPSMEGEQWFDASKGNEAESCCEQWFDASEGDEAESCCKQWFDDAPEGNDAESCCEQRFDAPKDGVDLTRAGTPRKVHDGGPDLARVGMQLVW